MKTTRFQMRCEDKLLKQMKKLVRSRGMTLTQFVEKAFRDALAEEQNQHVEAEQIT